MYGTVQQSKKDIRRYGGGLVLSGKIIESNELGLTLFASEEENENTNRYTGSGFGAVRTDPYKSYVGTVNWLGASLQDTQYYQAHSLTLGIDYLVDMQDSLSYNPDGTRKASYTPKSETNTLGFFGQLMLKFWEDRLVGNVGARLDVIELSTKETDLRDDFTPGTSDFTTFNPSAGLKFRLVDGLHLHSTIGTAFVAPTPSEMAGYSDTGTNVTRGNPDLDPESSLTWDVGPSYEYPK